MWGSGLVDPTASSNEFQLQSISNDFDLKVGIYTVKELTAISKCEQFSPTQTTAPNCKYRFSLTFCEDNPSTPVFSDCLPSTEYSGTFDAFGPGPADREIIGGTGDFVGASGWVATNGSFQAETPSFGSSPFIFELYFYAAIEICF